MNRDEYTKVVADLLNRDTPGDRERRVRDANRVLYRALIDPNATNVEADLALADVAQIERG